MKVVKNACYGGYGLSDKAINRLSEITGKSREQCVNDYDFGFEKETRIASELIQVIEELGEDASGTCAKLVIVEIPDDVIWEIEEYDGWETIEEVHRSW